MTRQQVINGLKEIGACFAVSDEKFVGANDPYMAKPTYHVHPYASNPQQDDIIRFASLAEIAEYIQMRRKHDAAAPDTDQQYAIYERWNMSR